VPESSVLQIDRQHRTAWLRGLLLLLVVVPSGGLIGLGFTGNLIVAIVALGRREPRVVAVHLLGCGVAILTLSVYPHVFHAQRRRWRRCRTRLSMLASA
jgi:hypothetical protein